MARHDGERRRQPTVGHGDPGVGGHGDRRRDTGHHLELDAGGGEGLGLLASTAEDEGVAALEPHDAASGAALLHEHGVDLRLVHGIAGPLADVDPLRPRGGEVEERPLGQTVVDDQVRPELYEHYDHVEQRQLLGLRGEPGPS